ncbi:helix-turn-helix domain-containing protein [Sphingobacterium daejeonense]|uniref:helix-turn-helix domain-containing protein n=1 Tax=Sphingobacterium daejeonense TaxID=371142 RepID=UPI0021A77D3D|nr:helix-turn-helix transcriptional regulator [Sphingobacterium daejeonense]MCT1532319.1 helix-turn-helix domain-containing protein [Sphingobacterium daejeonense]
MSNNDKAYIGLNIKKFRERLKFTQEDIANYLNIQRPIISYIENGDRDCTLEQLEKLSKLFNVELSELLEENLDKQTLNYVFAFRTNELTPKDIISIAEFQEVIKNYLKIKTLTNG